MITAMLQLFAAAFGLFVLLIVLNGYSERHATPALIAYIVLCLASVPGMGALSVTTFHALVKRKFLGSLGASLCATIGIAILGVLVVVASAVLVITVAEVLRKIR